MLRMEDVDVRLGRFRLQSISLYLKKGEYAVVLGPTGTGKTVLLETIAGMHRLQSGKIFIGDKDVSRLPPEARNLGVVYQDYALFPHLTVYDNIAFGLKIRRKPRREIKRAVDNMAQFLGIEPLLKRRPVNLSGGERQRVSLARALILDPYVLLLDEPLSALDRNTRDRLRRELKRIHREVGVTILHITHDLTEAFYLADHMVIMKDGRILQRGKPEQILQNPRERAVAELVGIQNLIKGISRNNWVETDLGLFEVPLPCLDECGKQTELFLTIPSWCIDLDPGRAAGRYSWLGSMVVGDMSFANGHVEVELIHSSGEALRVTLSRREYGEYEGKLDTGKTVKVGIRKQGISCVTG